MPLASVTILANRAARSNQSMQTNTTTDPSARYRIPFNQPVGPSALILSPSPPPTPPDLVASPHGHPDRHPDRKSTRLNSSHLGISYAALCLKKIHGASSESTPRSKCRLCRLSARPHGLP